MTIEAPAKIPCPPADDLRRLLKGKLPEEKANGVTCHLDDCSGCRSKLELIAEGDTNLTGVVKHIDQMDPPKDSAYWRAYNSASENDTGDFPQIPDAKTAAPKLDFLTPLNLPKKIGRLGEFQVIEEIGRGGMGIVLRAFDPNLAREVAMKVLSPELANNQTARDRFTREAKAAASVAHEHIVAVHTVSEDERSKLPYFVMQLVKGETLEDRIRKEGKLPVNMLVKIAYQTALGLAAAHAAGLIHRDIKPGNILLEDGTDKARLTDFGLARAEEDMKLTRTGFVAGTPLYMAPEQAKGDTIDARADLFSLGAVMYEALAGRPPFDGNTPLAVLRRVADEAHPRLARLNPDVPDWLEDIIDELLEKDPAKRTQSASLLASALAAHFSSENCAVPPPADCTVARTASRIAGTRRMSALTTTLVLGAPLLLGVVLGGIAGWGLKPREVDRVVERVPATGSDSPNSQSAGLLPGPEPLKTFDAMTGAVWSVAVAGDAATIVAGLEDGGFLMWDLNKGDNGGERIVQQLGAHDAPIWAVAITTDGKRVMTASDDRTVKIWDVTGPATVVATLKHEAGVRSAAFDTSEKKAVTGDRDGVVHIWDIASEKEIKQFKHGGVISAVAFDPLGRTVASGSSNKTVTLWDVESGRKRALLDKHTGAIYSLAFAPQGDLLATASWDKSVMIWDTGSGQWKRTLEACHDGAVWSVAFASCGKLLATAAEDGVIKLWNADTGVELDRFARHKGTIHGVRFAPSHALLVSAGRDGTVRTWSVKKAAADCR